jgi:hypothetical protein
LPWHRVVGVGGEIKLRGAAAYEQRARLKWREFSLTGRGSTWNISNIPLSHGRSTSDWIVFWTDQFWLHNSHPWPFCASGCTFLQSAGVWFVLIAMERAYCRVEGFPPCALSASS